MLRYHVAFYLPHAPGEMVVAEALDFPGAVTQGEGSRQTMFTNSASTAKAPVPRHSEIDNRLAIAIGEKGVFATDKWRTAKDGQPFLRQQVENLNGIMALPCR